MRLVKFEAPGGTARVGILHDGRVRPVVDPMPRGRGFLSRLLHESGGSPESKTWTIGPEAWPLQDVPLLAPIDDQEVWGAGVTYLRSKQAREEESGSAASCYDMVYTADRPELFFKATPSRVVGPGQPIRVRADSKWTVPEPELALVIAPDLRLVGFTIGNDVSARDIEGRNPLYLPQAKVYAGCCALGPVITLANTMPPPAEVAIRLEIKRDDAIVFAGSTSLGRMARRFEELIEWLGRDNTFPDGVILLTGTGIVPPDDFCLRGGDVVSITIDGIGTLTNPVVQASP